MARKKKTEVRASGWLLARFLPVSLFTLKTAFATGKGGKTLLVPTPWSVKLALVAACFRRFEGNEARENAEEVFHAVKEAEIRFKPPRRCVVQNTFVKIRQEKRGAPKGIYDSTISYREFCHYEGELVVALGNFVADGQPMIEELLPCLNCFGKRGSFFQFLNQEKVDDTLPAGFTAPVDRMEVLDPGFGVLHHLDDMGDSLAKDRKGFDRINSYGKSPVALGKHRVLVPTFVPYRRLGATRRYTVYEGPG